MDSTNPARSALKQPLASCLKLSSYAPKQALKRPSSTLPPVRLAPKHRKSKSKKRPNNYVSPLFHDRGHPHPQDDWESMLPEVKAGRLIRKRRHPAPPLTDIDPNFGVEYDDIGVSSVKRVSHFPSRTTSVRSTLVTHGLLPAKTRRLVHESSLLLRKPLLSSSNSVT